MYAQNRGASCGRCTEEIGLATVSSPKLERVRLSTSAGWDGWQQDLAGLLGSLVDGPVHVFIVDAPGDRYVQMQIGHGRCLLEVSTSTTLSESGVNVELIAKHLIDGGFAPPVGFRRRDLGSPNWALELDSVSPAPLAEFVTRVCRDLMQVDVHEIATTGFLVDAPCAGCHWGEE